MLTFLLCALVVEPRVEPAGKVEIRLEFSSKTFEPLKPGKETVKGVVVNNTGKPIMVPTVYDGRAVQIETRPRAKKVRGWNLRLFVHERRDPKWVELKPGARKV